jgi:sugar phosphate isomerase/epimerase
MKLEFFKTLWGHTGPYAAAADLSVEAGFAGLEGPIPTDAAIREEFLEALKSRNLSYIAEISTTGFAVPDSGSTPRQHLDAFERILAHSLEASLRFFTSMAGSDLWEFSESVAFFQSAKAIADRYGVRVGFETHRSRSLFHPIVTKNILREIPDLEITIDFSHWCNVCERLVLDELPDVLELCAQRVLHIQPRVGYDQGAQIPDPRSPLYRAPIDAHLRWWKTLWAGQQKRGFTEITLTPEFGPDGYQQIDPQTGTPHGDLWEFNQYMAQLLRQEFEQYHTCPYRARLS